MAKDPLNINLPQIKNCLEPKTHNDCIQHKDEKENNFFNKLME
jgi:hypothetical protein